MLDVTDILDTVHHCGIKNICFRELFVPCLQMECRAGEPTLVGPSERPNFCHCMSTGGLVIVLSIDMVTTQNYVCFFFGFEMLTSEPLQLHIHKRGNVCIM